MYPRFPVFSLFFPQIFLPFSLILILRPTREGPGQAIMYNKFNTCITRENGFTTTFLCYRIQ